MVKWVIGKIHIDKEVKYVFKWKTSFENQHSIIPCVRQKEHASIKHFYFPALAG
jgi:hypothetical protein